MTKIKVTVMRERKSFEKAEVEVDVQFGDMVDEVVARAELNANDLSLWEYHDFSNFPYVSTEDQQKIADTASTVEEQP